MFKNIRKHMVVNKNPSLGRAGPERRGPERLDTSEGSGHFLNKSLAFSLAHPHMFF